MRAQTSPGDSATRLPEHAPEEPEPRERLFGDFEAIVPDARTHWQHPRFFAYFPANAAPALMWAEQLANAIAASNWTAGKPPFEAGALAGRDGLVLLRAPWVAGQVDGAGYLDATYAIPDVAVDVDLVGQDSGDVYPLGRVDGTWKTFDRHVLADTADGQRFGNEIDLSGTYAVISAWGDGEAAPYAGAAYVLSFEAAGGGAPGKRWRRAVRRRRRPGG